MNLLEIRQKFREISGRFDLVNGDGSDNGANFYINEGRKYLDRLDETQKSWASHFVFMEESLFSVQFPYCRAIKEVWAGSTTARWQLEKKSLQDITTGYLSGMPSDRESGVPLYFSPIITRYVPENLPASSFEAFIGFVDIPAGNVPTYNGIIVNVPTDERLVIEIRGLFYSHELTLDTDSNYWSVVHPLLLIMATMRQIEIVNRNTQGVNDWTTSITDEMKQLGMDLVEELIAEVTQIED